MKRHVFSLALVLFLIVPCGFGKTLYFPHVGDGGGLQTNILLTNPSGKQASALKVSFFDSNGGPLSLPVSDSQGSFSNVASLQLVLDSPGSRKLVTSGGSNPVRSGYAVIETEEDSVQAQLVFQFADGRRTSVLPVGAGKRFSLPVERDLNLDTGLASVIVQGGVSGDMILTLFRENERTGLKRIVTMNGPKRAVFLSEIFDEFQPGFRGHLEMEMMSATQRFVPLGLQFGQNALSTLEVTADKPEAELQTEKTIGLIMMEYADKTRRLSLSDLRDDPQAPGLFFARGLNERGQLVIGGYSPDLNAIVLTSAYPNSALDDVFVFNFNKDGTLTGCRTTRDRASGQIQASCEPLVGARYDALAAQQQPPTPPPLPATVFDLPYGQAATIGSPSSLKIRFEDVPHDSRCPEGVNCVTAGFATVRIGYGLPLERDLPTADLAAGDTNQPASLVAEGWRVTFTGLKPSMPASGTIDKSQYVATFKVEQATAYEMPAAWKEINSDPFVKRLNELAADPQF